MTDNTQTLDGAEQQALRATPLGAEALLWRAKADAASDPERRARYLRRAEELERCAQREPSVFAAQLAAHEAALVALRGGRAA